MPDPVQHPLSHQQDTLDRLLAFLGCDLDTEGLLREEVRRLRGARYEEIRRRQIKLFAWRGCADPELLADRTFDRVAAKVGQPGFRYVGNPAHYVASVGRHIYLESLHQPAEPPALPVPEKSEQEERVLDCLDRCLEEVLNAEDRRMILEYYEGEKRDRIERREQIAQRHGLSLNGLRIHSFRLRRRLRNCLDRRLDGK